MRDGTRAENPPGRNRAPIWFPDGQRVAYSQSVDGIQEIFAQPADGSSAAVALTQGSSGSVLPNDISPDQSILLYTLYREAGADADIWMTRLDGAPTTGTPLIEGPADERSARLSPDGRWLAYQSDESGRYEVYVRPFPDVSAARWQISEGGGLAPLWSGDGTELYFFVEANGPGDRIMAVPIELGPTFRVSRPTEAIGEADFPAPGLDGPFYDVSDDGQRFLMIRNPTGRIADDQPSFVIVQNWFEELERLVPTE